MIHDMICYYSGGLEVHLHKCSSEMSSTGSLYQPLLLFHLVVRTFGLVCPQLASTSTREKERRRRGGGRHLFFKISGVHRLSTAWDYFSETKRKDFNIPVTTNVVQILTKIQPNTGRHRQPSPQPLLLPQQQQQQPDTLTMATTGMQLLGLILSLVGWVGGFLVCSVPLWRVTAFIGNNIVTAQIIWEGLWMTCIVQSTGQIQCKVYDSLLALPSDMQAARGLTVLSVLLCGLALALGVVGVKCTKCIGQNSLKARIARISGFLFGIAGFLYLVPICWTAHSIIRDFYDPHVAAPHKRELGPALYLGWGASALLLIGGSLLYAGSSPPGIPGSPTFSSDSSPRRGPAAQVKGYV